MEAAQHVFSGVESKRKLSELMVVVAVVVGVAELTTFNHLSASGGGWQSESACQNRCEWFYFQISTRGRLKFLHFLCL